MNTQTTVGKLSEMGSIPRRPRWAFETKISVRTLYRYIDMSFIPSGSNKDLPIKQIKDKRKKKGKLWAARNCKGKSIEERQEVDGWETPGHWEMDTVVSKKGGSLVRVLSTTERMTHWQINVKIKTGETKSLIEVLDKLEKKLGEKFSFIFKTITVDNGSEFADIEGMEQSCLDSEKKRLTVYHCHPYCSSERGSNEKQNGMTRRRYPKGPDFRKVSKKKLRETTAWINNYPRKMFDFHPSTEAFEAAFPRAASAIQKIL